jgi:PKD repeat protein
VSPTTGESGTSVQLVPTITGTPDTWIWDFGGGAAPNFSTVESPSVILGAEGTYSASLTATDSVSGDSDIYTFDLIVGPSTAPPDVTDVNPKTGASGTQLIFRGTYQGNPPTEYLWDFGGGATPNTSTDVEPFVTLGAPGTYSASLEVSNANGTDTFDFTLEVVDDSNVPDIWGISPTDAEAGTTVQLALWMDPTKGVADTWEWNFDPNGDGSLVKDGTLTSSEESPTIQVGDQGLYEIAVTASNSFGSDTWTSFNEGVYFFVYIAP